jgi:hypothetical protein
VSADGTPNYAVSATTRQARYPIQITETFTSDFGAFGPSTETIELDIPEARQLAAQLLARCDEVESQT